MTSPRKKNDNAYSIDFFDEDGPACEAHAPAFAGLPGGSEVPVRLAGLIREAGPVRAAYRIAPLSIDRGVPTLGALTLPGATVATLGLAPGAAFPFVITAGATIDALLDSLTDPLERYRADCLAVARLDGALVRLRERIRAAHATGPLALYLPGNAPEFPIEDIARIIAAIGGAAARLGLRLNDSGTMVPLKSIAGIFLPAVREMDSCEICAMRDACDRRR
ncbi:MAG TPA: hypothetical protein PKM65_10415 [Spirochaetota bacterium]|nr:hypothetical protein [Spirochaetota bacterium]HNT12286.1 hypothetical protein [Spirochaetota bacterium]